MKKLIVYTEGEITVNIVKQEDTGKDGFTILAGRGVLNLNERGASDLLSILKQHVEYGG